MPNLASLAVIILMTAVAALSAFTKSKEQIQVTVMATDSQEYKYQGGGLFGIAVGSRTKNQVFALNTIINGEHVKLECQGNHSGCTAMTPGTYDADFDGKSIWVISEKPLTHKKFREHWKLAGRW